MPPAPRTRRLPSSLLTVGAVWLGLTLLPAAPALSATEAEFLRLIARADAAYADVRAYTAVMLSVERVNEILEPTKRVLLKFQRPFSVYMRWLEGPGKGREGLYIAGENDGKFVVAEPEGIAKFFAARLDPSDPRVLERSRHPVTDVGIGRLLEIVGENARRAVREKAMRLRDHGLGTVAGRPVRQIEGILPQDSGARYYGYRITLSFDEENHLPIRVVTYDWQDRLVEDYTYTQLVLNPGLTARDFDFANPEYGFSHWRLRLP